MGEVAEDEAGVRQGPTMQSPYDIDFTLLFGDRESLRVPSLTLLKYI